MTSNEKRQERDRKHEKASRRGQSARGKELLEKRAGRYAENSKNKHEHSLRSRNLFLHRTEHFKSPDQRESINQTVEKQIVDENFQKKKHEQPVIKRIFISLTLLFTLFVRLSESAGTAAVFRDRFV